jgi:hypothetical protein
MKQTIKRLRDMNKQEIQELLESIIKSNERSK